MRATLGPVLIAGLVLTMSAPAWSQLNGPIPPGRVVSGRLSFDGHATVGDFTGVTTDVRGEMSGGPGIEAVRGWVEAPVSTLKTGDRKRDRDLNGSMESEQYPTIRFELTRVAPQDGAGDSMAVTLQGTMMIHGVTREVSLPARVAAAGEGIRVESDFPLNLKDYEIGGLSRMLGMLRMYEDIEVHVDLTFAPM